MNRLFRKLNADYEKLASADDVREYVVMPRHAKAPVPRDLDCGHRSGNYATDYRDGSTRCLDCHGQVTQQNG